MSAVSCLRSNVSSCKRGEDLWIEVGSFVFKLFYKNECWNEGIMPKGSIVDFFISLDDDLEIENDYLRDCIRCYQLATGELDESNFEFAGRSIHFVKSRVKDGVQFFEVQIQSGDEDEYGHFNIEIEFITRHDLVVFANFFNLSSLSFLSEVDFFVEDDENG